MGMAKEIKPFSWEFLYIILYYPGNTFKVPLISQNRDLPDRTG